jgi:hypothetical protein
MEIERDYIGLDFASFGFWGWIVLFPFAPELLPVLSEIKKSLLRVRGSTNLRGDA